MRQESQGAVSILDSLLDWLVEIGQFAPDLPGLERAKGMAARARELIVINDDDGPTEIVVIRRKRRNQPKR